MTFTSRNDYARVIKLLLAHIHAYADRGAPNYLDDVGDRPSMSWTAVELEAADRYLLDVTQYPGYVSVGRIEPNLELTLLTDDDWDPNEED